MLTELLEKNRKWSMRMTKLDPEFFLRLTRQQAPEFLWIGCADSRVPANEIVSLLPGELFVHRNVANVVVHTDLNCLSVLHFAVEVLKVKHIIVCGHYGCGGVKAAMENAKLGLIDNWLRHIQDVHHKHHQCMSEVEDSELAANRLCELNVIEQVVNVAQTTIVQDAWNRDQGLSVHGWIYGLHDGLLRDLRMTVSSAESLEPIYHGAVAALVGK